MTTEEKICASAANLPIGQTKYKLRGKEFSTKRVCRSVFALIALSHTSKETVSLRRVNG
jgi:hypothetical protein